MTIPPQFPAAVDLSPTGAEAVAPDWDKASNLPPDYYYRPDIYSLELERVFLEEWIYVGRVEDIPNAGDFFTIEVAGISVIVARDAEDRIRAYLNVCRHRNARLIEDDEGCVKSIRCPYHGWLYALNGELRATPEFAEVLDFDKREYPLHDVNVMIWEGFILICFAQEPPSFTDRLQGTQVWGLDKYDMANRVTTHQWRYTLKANWKIRAENDIDSYHLPWVHAATLNAWTPVKGYADILPTHLPSEHRDAAWALLLGRFPGFTYSDTGEPYFSMSPGLDDIAPEWQGMPVVQIFPAFTVNPTADALAVYMTYPLGPEESEIRVRLCIPTEQAKRFHDGDQEIVDRAQEYADNMEAAFREDDRICEVQQRGLKTRGATAGRYGPREQLVHAFDKWLLDHVYRDLNGARA